jgi:hypothetical protein
MRRVEEKGNLNKQKALSDDFRFFSFFSPSSSSIIFASQIIQLIQKNNQKASLTFLEINCSTFLLPLSISLALFELNVCSYFVWLI